MVKNQQIFIKLQLEKHPETQRLYIKAHFDHTAPNFEHTEDEISWVPTPDELEFLRDCFQMLTTMQK